MSLSKLKEILRELIKQELEEASYTSNIPGYQTSCPFTDPKKDKKKKKKHSQVDINLQKFTTEI